MLNYGNVCKVHVKIVCKTKNGKPYSLVNNAINRSEDLVLYFKKISRNWITFH